MAAVLIKYYSLISLWNNNITVLKKKNVNSIYKHKIMNRELKLSYVSKSPWRLYSWSFQEESFGTVGSVCKVNSVCMAEDYPITEER